MILHTENLKDDWDMCEVARTLSTYLEDCFIYDLIAGDGYEELEGHPLCIVKDNGSGFDIVFNPYGQKGLRRKIFLHYEEADSLMKLLCYIDRQIKNKEKENT